MINTITNNKILSHLNRVMGDHKPITADVFLDNYCNNNCPYCTYKRWDFHEDARYMSFNDFKQYASRLVELGVLGIILTGGGEPTISKDFDKITSWLENQGIKYGINTNFNRYVECNPEYLKVSLDAYDRESYKQVRGVDEYDIVRDNICRFAEYKTDDTRLGIQMVAKSADDVWKFHGANKDLPVDYIVIRPVESTDGKYYQRFKDEAYIEPMIESPKVIIKAIENVMAEDDRVVMNFKWHMLDTRFEQCSGQWSQIALNELGEVMYCCHKPYQIVGHIMDEDILDKKIKAVTDMKMCDVPCRLTSVNSILSLIDKDMSNAEFI